MKKYFPYILSLVVLSVSLILFLSSQDPVKSEQQSPEVLAMIKSVKIPDQVQFAGEKIDLTRYNNHERFDREINIFSYMHASTMLLFKRANRYFPIIEPILKKNGVPDDFKYLAVIESYMDPRAVSPARAGGLWQLLQGTAREKGLEVTSQVDERFSIEKSTEAACKYLRAAHSRYGNWIDAAASYNAGMARISNELSDQQEDSALDLWLNTETSRYVFRMAAIKTVFESPYKYGFVLTPETFYKPIEFKDVTVTSSISSLTDFAKSYGITYADLKEFNSWLRDDNLTVGAGNSYTIQIPTKESLSYKGGDVKVHDPRWLAQ